MKMEFLLFYGLCLILTRISWEIYKRRVRFIINYIGCMNLHHMKLYIYLLYIIYKVHGYIFSLHHGRSHVYSNLGIDIPRLREAAG